MHNRLADTSLINGAMEKVLRIVVVIMLGWVPTAFATNAPDEQQLPA